VLVTESDARVGGLIGLAVGIAFRDITENFLASNFLSMQWPFETGDLTVTVLDGQLAAPPSSTPGNGPWSELLHEETAAVSTKAEAGLYSEAVVIEEQARQAQPYEGAENLLRPVYCSSTIP